MADRVSLMDRNRQAKRSGSGGFELFSTLTKAT